MRHLDALQGCPKIGIGLSFRRKLLHIFGTILTLQPWSYLLIELSQLLSQGVKPIAKDVRYSRVHHLMQQSVLVHPVRAYRDRVGGRVVLPRTCRCAERNARVADLGEQLLGHLSHQRRGAGLRYSPQRTAQITSLNRR